MKNKFPYDDDGPFGDQDEPDKEKRNLDLLEAFTGVYVPATKDTMTDLFSTNEVQKIIQDFTGVELPSSTIYELLLQMNYKYQLEENNFMWMVKKEV